MAPIGFIKGQFIEVIEWTDNTSNTIVHKFPVRNSNIKMGAQLTVRESQAAIFVNEGIVADLFTPGRYMLSTQNMPVMTALNSWRYGFNSPFKADVYFVNTKQFTNQKWGTTNPVMMRDPELGALRLRGFGTYAFRVSDPLMFLKEIFGTSQTFETEDISNQLKSFLVSALTDCIAELRVPAFDLAMHYGKIGEAACRSVAPRFEAYGLKLTSVIVENLSLPPEVEKVLDQRTSMGVIGNALPQYAQYQATEAMRDAARNPGGFSGAGVSMGAGAAMGRMMGDAMGQLNQQAQQQAQQQAFAQQQAQQQAFAQQQAQQQAQTPSAPGASGSAPRFCHQCGASLASNARFCPQCGEKLQ